MVGSDSIITGPLGNSKGYNYLFVIIDEFTLYMNAVSLPNISAEECVDEFIRLWVTLFGTPQHIFNDRGTRFTSSLWPNMCNYLGTQQHHAIAYHSQAQSQIERLNGTLSFSIPSGHIRPKALLLGTKPKYSC